MSHVSALAITQKKSDFFCLKSDMLLCNIIAKVAAYTFRAIFIGVQKDKRQKYGTSAKFPKLDSPHFINCGKHMLEGVITRGCAC